jgi:hypothetical protein
LFLDALLGSARTRSAFVLGAEGNIIVAAFAAVKIRGGGRPDDVVINDPCIAAVRLAHQTGRLITMLRGNSTYPMLRIDFEVRIAGNVSILQFGPRWFHDYTLNCNLMSRS